MSRLIGITGGIGAGKSVVSRILAAKGYPVYDCDSRAKVIMDNDPHIHDRLCREIHPLVVVGGNIDRRLLSEIVFSDSAALGRLNAIVHAAVEADVDAWTRIQTSPLAFVESAILYQCKLADMVDAAIEVDAPLELRVARVISRSALTRQQVLDRISTQKANWCSVCRNFKITNDGFDPILPQINTILSSL